jgi:hypothetical protein
MAPTAVAGFPPNLLFGDGHFFVSGKRCRPGAPRRKPIARLGGPAQPLLASPRRQTTSNKSDAISTRLEPTAALHRSSTWGPCGCTAPLLRRATCPAIQLAASPYPAYHLVRIAPASYRPVRYPGPAPLQSPALLSPHLITRPFQLPTAEYLRRRRSRGSPRPTPVGIPLALYSADVSPGCTGLLWTHATPRTLHAMAASPLGTCGIHLGHLWELARIFF